MNELIAWFARNVEWVFSGIGVFIIGLIVAGIAKGRSRGVTQNQKAASHSTNVQVGGDVKINHD
ncbi:hypothetical protein ACO0LL_18810 [Undibacterium sp. TC4M20W]|uniref:hypothetical protein n=1 Tax=unclassified Undibacterium TaxID=2630295 RepID=UPI003BF1E630